MLCRDSIKTEGRRPIVLEMTGPLEISPAAQRHKGFSEAISRETYIDYRHVPSKWSHDDCKRIMRQWLKDGKTADVVFCHSDLAAVGAYEAAKELHKEREIRFLGIDGLPGEGIDAVQKGQLAASYIYPTHGEEVIALAQEAEPAHCNNTVETGNLSRFLQYSAHIAHRGIARDPNVGCGCVCYMACRACYTPCQPSYART